MSNEMECGCACDVSDGEPIYNLKQALIKARSTHVCDECGEAIVPGEQYELTTGYCDGALRLTTCRPCMLIRNSFCCFLGGLREELKHVLGFDYVTGKETNDD